MLQEETWTLSGMTSLWCWVSAKNGNIFLNIFSGEHDVEDDSEAVTFKSKAEGISHPRFYYRLSLGEIDYDVGLLTLETPIDFTNETFSHIR